MNTNHDLIRGFAYAVCRPDDEINLAEAALLIAKSEYPELDVQVYLKRLDEMASVVDRRLKGDRFIGTVIREMNHFLFKEQGFVGNTPDYFDPRNNFLNEVLDRKLGIPISLSIIYMEIGQRLGLPLAGVSFPGHFLVKLSVNKDAIVLDPFYGGLSLSEEDLILRLQGFISDYNESKIDLGWLLSTASKKDILVRMLQNLKGIYVTSGDFCRALKVVQQVLIINPGDPNEIRDRGFIYEELECFQAAAWDYQHYLELVPNADDSELVRVHYLQMQHASARLH